MMIDLFKKDSGEVTDDEYKMMYCYFKQTEVFDKSLPKLSDDEVFECV